MPIKNPGTVSGGGGGEGKEGKEGARGYSVLHGEGKPSNNVGNNEEFYIDTTAHIIYGPKAGGVWPETGTQLVGTGISNYREMIEKDEPSEYWPMQEKQGTKFSEAIGSAGELSPMPGGGVITPAVEGPWKGELAVEFDGKSRLQSVNAGSLAAVKQSFSMEAWVYVPVASSSSGHIIKAGNSAGGFGLAKGTTGAEESKAPGPYPLGLIELIEWINPSTEVVQAGWHHFGIIFKEILSTKIVQTLLMLDGEIILTHGASLKEPLSIGESNGFIMVGGRASSTTKEGNLIEPYTGRICHVALYNRAVNPSLFSKHAGFFGYTEGKEKTKGNNSLQPLFYEPFTENNLAAFTFDQGTSSTGLVIEGGVLKAAGEADHSWHDTKVKVIDFKAIAKFVPGNTKPGPWYLNKYVDDNNFAMVQFQGLNKELLMYQRVAGAYTQLTKAVISVSVGVTYWMVMRMFGNKIRGELWESDPRISASGDATSFPSPLVSIEGSLTSGGASVLGAGKEGFIGARFGKSEDPGSIDTMDDWLIVSLDQVISGENTDF